MDPYAINESACRGRQWRLLDAVSVMGVDLVVLTSRESIQWLTGAQVRPPFEPVAAMTMAGRVTLVVPERQLPEPAAVDEKIGYPAKLHSTMCDDQRAASSAALQRALPVGFRSVGAEFATFSPHLSFLALRGRLRNIGPTMFELRRRKDVDELTMLARANDANRAMYERAREIVRPGVHELEVYAELQATAVRTLGEPLTYFGQDFQCGSRGGPPRDREALAGELYILDLGVGFRGYYSDNARTLAVSGEPTATQQRAWEALMQVFPLVEASVRPGVSCRTLFHAVERQLHEFQPWQCNHHLGHGVGLAAHEAPHLNPHWDDTFAEGDFFTVEPGLYHDELRHGIRLEQNFLVTANGVELLTPWPMVL